MMKHLLFPFLLFLFGCSKEDVNTTCKATLFNSETTDYKVTMPAYGNFLLRSGEVKRVTLNHGYAYRVTAYQVGEVDSTFDETILCNGYCEEILLIIRK